MKRWHKLVLIAAALSAGVIAAVILGIPTMQRSFFYPKAGNLPPAVAEPIDQLLADLQMSLNTNAPIVAQALQPGLSDARISELEAQGGFRLSDDLRALYRWHNGVPSDSRVKLLPSYRFVTLDEVAANHVLMSHFRRTSEKLAANPGRRCR